MRSLQRPRQPFRLQMSLNELLNSEFNLDSSLVEGASGQEKVRADRMNRQGQVNQTKLCVGLLRLSLRSTPKTAGMFMLMREASLNQILDDQRRCSMGQRTEFARRDRSKSNV